MGLFGTIIGGGLGFMMGGPLGAIIGGAIGANLGEMGGARPHPGARMGGRPQYQGGPGRGADPLQLQQAFLTAVISLAAKVAKADGAVSPEEVRSFDGFLRDQLRMPAAERKLAAHVFNQARDSDIPAEDFARQIRQMLGHQPHRMRDIVSLLGQVAMADGRLDPAEERMIRSIAGELGLGQRDYDEALAMFNPTANLDAAYATLGVDPSAADTEVKKAYRNLAKEYHPDIIASKGMGEDFNKFAEDKMKAINEAWSEVEKARGL